MKIKKNENHKIPHKCQVSHKIKVYLAALEQEGWSNTSSAKYVKAG